MPYRLVVDRLLSYIDAPDQLARAAVDVNAGLVRLCPAVGYYLVFISVDGCRSLSMSHCLA